METIVKLPILKWTVELKSFLTMREGIKMGALVPNKAVYERKVKTDKIKKEEEFDLKWKIENATPEEQFEVEIRALKIYTKEIKDETGKVLEIEEAIDKIADSDERDFKVISRARKEIENAQNKLDEKDKKK